MIRRPPRSTPFPTRRSSDLGVHTFAARAISRLLPEGGTCVDLGCGSGRLLSRLARGRPDATIIGFDLRSEEHTSELQSRQYLVCRLLLGKKKTTTTWMSTHT